MMKKLMGLLICTAILCAFPMLAFAENMSSTVVPGNNFQVLQETPDGTPITLEKEYTSVDENGFVVRTQIYNKQENTIEPRVLISKYVVVQKTYIRPSNYPKTLDYDETVDGIHWVGILEIIATNTEREWINIAYGGDVYANLG